MIDADGRIRPVEAERGRLATDGRTAAPLATDRRVFAAIFAAALGLATAADRARRLRDPVTGRRADALAALAFDIIDGIAAASPGENERGEDERGVEPTGGHLPLDETLDLLDGGEIHTSTGSQLLDGGRVIGTEVAELKIRQPQCDDCTVDNVDG